LAAEKQKILSMETAALAGAAVAVSAVLFFLAAKNGAKKGKKTENKSRAKRVPKKGKKKWRPYEHSGRWFGGLGRGLVAIRWFILGCSPLTLRLPRTNFTVGELISLGFVLSVSVVLIAGSSGDEEGSGEVALAPIALAFATASHNSLLTLLLGLPFERQLFWHKLFAILAVVSGFVHAIAAEGPLPCCLDNPTGTKGSGWWMELCMAALCLSFIPQLRRHLFEVFYRFHWVLFIALLVFALFHEGTTLIFVGVFFWGVDVAIRLLWQAALIHGHKAELVCFPADVVRIYLPKVCPFPRTRFFAFFPILLTSTFLLGSLSLQGRPVCVLVHTTSLDC
jgi:Ferric reductase like transmembrane component